MTAFPYSELKKGVKIILDSEPYEIIESSHLFKGRGHSVLQGKLKNLTTGNLISKTFHPSDIFEEAEGSLTLDVYQTPSSIIVESAVAGVNPEDLDISITSDSVSVRGKREKMEKVEEKDYLFQECYWGRFSRSIMLPQEVDPDRAQASLKNGVLKIILPKLNKQKTKKLKVKFD